jgi:ABC-2 type transport system permease protein
VAARLPAGGSAYLALATVSPVPVFVGIGALASQLAPTRRLALEISSSLLVAALLMRIVADTSSSLDRLRWATPLGWAEELRPFAGPRPAVLLAPLFVSALLLVVSGLIAVRRDVGNGLVRSSDSAAPSLRLLSSPTAQALRGERGSLIGWVAGIAFFAVVMGMISNALSSANLSENLQRQLHKLGASFDTPSDALGFYFLFFVLAIGLFACSQIAAARREEADQQLETLFALPVGRRSWLAGRLLLASAAATALALAAAVFAWAGARSQGVSISFPRMLEAGANCLPAALLFLALGALAFALLPRASAGIAYALVSVAFAWEEFGSALGAPSWTLALSPFHHVGLVPAESFKAAAAVIMLGIAAIATIAATRIFERRDLTAT